MTQQPPPAVKKPKSWKIVAIVVLVIAIVIGAVGAVWWWTQQSRYTRVKIFTDSLARVTLGGYNYTFTYNWMWTSNLIGVDVEGSSAHYDFNATEGSRYQCLSIEIVVSEVHNDYIILLVKSL